MFDIFIEFLSIKESLSAIGVGFLFISLTLDRFKVLRLFVLLWTGDYYPISYCINNYDLIPTTFRLLLDLYDISPLIFNSI